MFYNAMQDEVLWKQCYVFSKLPREARRTKNKVEARVQVTSSSNHNPKFSPIWTAPGPKPDEGSLLYSWQLAVNSQQPFQLYSSVPENDPSNQPLMSSGEVTVCALCSTLFALFDVQLFFDTCVKM